MAAVRHGETFGPFVFLFRLRVSKMTAQSRRSAKSRARSLPQAAPLVVDRETAAELLGVCARTIDRSIKAGRIVAVNVGERSVRIRYSEIERLARAAGARR